MKLKFYTSNISYSIQHSYSNDHKTCFIDEIKILLFLNNIQYNSTLYNNTTQHTDHNACVYKLTASSKDTFLGLFGNNRVCFNASDANKEISLFCIPTSDNVCGNFKSTDNCLNKSAILVDSLLSLNAKPANTL